MSTQNVLQKAFSRPLELGAAVAVGAALAASVSLPIGVGLAVALMVPAIREKDRLTLREGLQLAIGATAVFLAVTAGISVMTNWADFKDGLMQGYQYR